MSQRRLIGERVLRSPKRLPNLGQHLLPAPAVGTVGRRAVRARPSEPASRPGGPRSAGKPTMCVLCVCGSVGTWTLSLGAFWMRSHQQAREHTPWPRRRPKQRGGCRLVAWCPAGPGLTFHTRPFRFQPARLRSTAVLTRQVRRQTAQAGTAARQGARLLFPPGTSVGGRPTRTDAAQKQNITLLILLFEG